MLIELGANIYLIRPEGKSVFPYSNSVFVDDEVKTVIDAGAGKAYREIEPERVNLLLLTHHHFDHIHGVDYFKNARIMAGKEELWAFTDKDRYMESLGYHRWEELMGSPKDDNWAKISLPADVLRGPGFQSIPVTAVFEDGDEIGLGHTSLTTVHVPGHSPGHYAFFFPQEKILFSADLDISPRGPWYGNIWADFDDLVKSIYKLIDLKPEILVTSHRKVFYDHIEEHFRQYLDVALRREEIILNYLNTARPINDIMNLDMGLDIKGPNQHIVFWNKLMVHKHLERLIKLGKVKKKSDASYVKTAN